MTKNVVDHPDHYNAWPVECIDVVELFNFNMGNAIKYIWRADYKGDPLTDLEKAAWYINREIKRRTSERKSNTGQDESPVGSKDE